MAENQDETEFMDDDSAGDANSPAGADQSAFEDAGASVSSMEPADTMANTRTLGQPLSDFLMTLEDYTPTVESINFIEIIP